MLLISNKYVSPAAEAAVYQSTGSWYSSAKSLDLFEVDLSLHVSMPCLFLNAQKSFVRFLILISLVLDIRDALNLPRFQQPWVAIPVFFMILHWAKTTMSCKPLKVPSSRFFITRTCKALLASGGKQSLHCSTCQRYKLMHSGYQNLWRGHKTQYKPVLVR